MQEFADGQADDEPDRLKNAPPIFYLWPCNVTTYNLWHRCQTQWHTGGMGGTRTGLCYAGVQAAMQHLGIPMRKRKTIFSGIQAMERAALSAWAEQQQSSANT